LFQNVANKKKIAMDGTSGAFAKKNNSLSPYNTAGESDDEPAVL